MRIKEDVCAYLTITPYTTDFILRNQSDPWEKRLSTADGWRKYLDYKVRLKCFNFDTGEIYQSEENLLRSLRRARKTVVNYALCNDFEFFGTVTVDGAKWDINRPDVIQKALSEKFRIYAQSHPDFKYVYVAEYGKKTHRLHFHFLATGLKIFINENGYPDCHLLRDNFGFCQISKIGEAEADKLYSSLYCSKYITKQSIRIAHRYIFCSKNLKRPEKLFLKGSLAIRAYDELKKMSANEFAHTRYLKCLGCRTSVWRSIWERLSVFRELRNIHWKNYRRFSSLPFLYPGQKLTPAEELIFPDDNIQLHFLS